MKINEWTPQDRPREKLIERGAQSLTDTELLAIILRSGTKEKSVVTQVDIQVIEVKYLCFNSTE